MSVNLFFTTVLHFINVNINNLWPGPGGAPGQDTPADAGSGEPGSTDQVMPGEHLRAADIPVAEENMEDDLPQNLGQAEGEGGLEVDNEIIVEEEDLDDTGTSAMSDASLYPEEHETVGVADVDEVVDAGPRERPRASGHRHVHRALARIDDFPPLWYDQPETCRRCAQARTRRLARCQFHLI